MRELKYYVACTVDGFIANSDGSFDGFLHDGDHVPDFIASYQWFDTVLMGRKTYEVALNAGVTNPYPSMRQYLFSRSIEQSPDENVTLVKENAVDLVTDLKKQAGKAIWLCGGANLAATLFTASLIDEIILKVIPSCSARAFPSFPKPFPGRNWR